MKKFSPLIFLASLGAGGITIIPFAFLNYAFDHPKGLVKYVDIAHGNLPIFQEILFRFLEVSMIVFVAIHLALSIVFFVKLIKWLKTKESSDFIADPLRNTAILAPFISIVMTMNVGIGPIRFFIPQMAGNLQSMMLPALIVWLLIGYFLMVTEIKLLKTSFIKSFDISKIHFGWLLHSFALAMYTVTGTGIAALAANADIANLAAFVSFIFGSMGVLLLLVKIVTVFKTNLAADGLPEKHLIPGFLIVIPIVTLYAISLFRIGHYLEHQFGAHLVAYYPIVTAVAFAFEIWYLIFGLSLMSDYLKDDFKKTYTVTQWGLVCPVVAFGVLGSFVYKFFVQSQVLYYAIIVVLVIAILLFFNLLKKLISCSNGSKKYHMCD